MAETEGYNLMKLVESHGRAALRRKALTKVVDRVGKWKSVGGSKKNYIQSDSRNVLRDVLASVQALDGSW